MLESPPQTALHGHALHLADIPAALASGWDCFARAPRVSMLAALPPAIIGSLLIGALLALGLSPMLLPAAGGYMILGPAMLAGFFRVRQRIDGTGAATLGDMWRGFRDAPGALWVVAMLCGFLFLIFITDAATLYAMMVGATAPASDPAGAGRFLLWSSVGGAVIAAIAFALSAFSVPLLLDGRAGLAQAVVASVKAVLRNLPVMLAWGAALTFAVGAATVFPPVLVVVLPVLAYASAAFYERAFPG